MSIDQLPIVIIVGPLFAAFLVGIAHYLAPRFVSSITGFTYLALFVASLILLRLISVEGSVRYSLGGWQAPQGIEFVVDGLSAIIIVLISGVSLIHFLFQQHRISKSFKGREGYYHVMTLFFVVGLLGMVSTGDVFNLYVFLEVTALSSYALLAGYGRRAAVATFRYLMMGSVGACFYLLGVGYLYLKSGTLNMADLQQFLPQHYDSITIMFGFIFIMLGLWTKMGFFPLHGWLPNAYSHAPPEVLTLVAPLSTKVAVYVMLRIIFSVYTPSYAFVTTVWGPFVVTLASVAVIAGATFALAQRNLLRMLSYIIVSEVGYMVGGVWLANTQGVLGAAYHVVADALMTLCLLLCVIRLRETQGGWELKDMAGAFRSQPYVMTVFVIAGLSIIGVPPLAGFFSKWYLIQGAIEAEKWFFVVALLLSSLVNAVLVFRVLEPAFYKSGKTQASGDAWVAPMPWGVRVSLACAALSLITVGFLSGYVTEMMLQSDLKLLL